MMELEDEVMMASQKKPRKGTGRKNLGKNDAAMPPDRQTATGNTPMLAQVVGIIIGSPEFQRR
jgi:hypothetical protein